jgi:predicted phosphoadenosine phosphosulfate sulfurtransferase
MKTYKKFKVVFHNNKNQLKVVYIDADSHYQATNKIMDKFNIYKAQISQVAWHSTVTL